jgi:hypothetical protein
MALSRLPIDEGLSAYLDGLAQVPPRSPGSTGGWRATSTPR